MSSHPFERIPPGRESPGWRGAAPPHDEDPICLLIYRPLASGELAKLGEIDRSERVAVGYRVRSL